MGLGHRFTEFLALAARLGPEGPRWVFAGGGKRRAEMEAFARAHPRARIELRPYVPAEQLAEHLAAADVHLASLDHRWQGLMVPSKIQGIFSSGRPVIFVGGVENEIAGWIRESGGGWCVAENDIEGLAQAVREAGDPVERARRGAAARRYAEEQFGMEANCGRMVEMLTNGTRKC